MKYESIKLKYLADIFNGNSIPDDLKSEYDGKEIPYIPTKELNVEDSTINYNNGLSVNREDGFKIAPTNSVLMCIEGGSAGRKIALTDREVAFVNKLCCISGVKVDSRYLFHALRSKDFTEQFFLNMTGLIGGVSINVLKNLYVSLPSNKETQRKLISILDQKCGKIDELIVNQEKQIEKLKEYKQSVITEAVTKGLDKSAPLKDSGIEWIGEIPAHWGITRIKNLFELRNERNDEADLSKVNLISLYTDLGVVQHSDIVETTGNRAVTAEGYKFVYKNDIVVNIILCWMGAVGMSNYDGVTSPAYDIYQPKKGTLSEYYHYLFRTKRFNGECYRYGRGIMLMRWRTYSAEFTAINIPEPPKQEQIEILSYLKEKSEKIDRLIAIKQSKIEKLQEYKKSLIYEYVTGKKEVV